MTDPADIEEMLFKCWSDGLGLEETFQAFKRLGLPQPDKEYIRQAFVRYAGARYYNPGV